MADKTSAANRGSAVPTDKKLDELYALIDGNDIAMFTTRRADGQLVSRPMATQERVTGMDLWFVTDISSDKLDELATDPHVNLAYYNTKSREWVSVSGTATISQDREIIRELYKPDWKAWFGDNGGRENGGPDDPRLALIRVDAHSVQYLVTTKPKPVVLFEVAKALVTGSTPNVGEQRTLGERELRTDAARDALTPHVVAFQGETGAFSEAAAARLVEAPIALMPCATFAAVVRAVVEGGADFGVLPVENLIAGPVHEAIAALDDPRLERVAEHSLPVHLALLGLADSSASKIREVLSHPVALRQCGRWLAGHPQVRVVESPDTAGAARMVAIRRDRHAAAIAAPWAAAHYGLSVLEEHLEDRSDNATRFVLVRRARSA